MATFLGKEIKTYAESTWSLVAGSAQQISKKDLKKVRKIEVRYSEEFDHLYATVYLQEGVVSWQLDRKFKGEEGDLIDPSTFMVYQITNGEKVITRCIGQVEE